MKINNMIYELIKKIPLEKYSIGDKFEYVEKFWENNLIPIRETDSYIIQEMKKREIFLCKKHGYIISRDFMNLFVSKGYFQKC